MSNSPLVFATPWQPTWVPEFIGTLNFVIRGDEVLLIHKKTGHGAGMINAPGGKLQQGETILQCAIRETKEEVGVSAAQMKCRAELRFVESNGPQWLGFVFVSHDYHGEPYETDEARPYWQAIDSIPYEEMWPDDAVWLPKVLDANEPFLVGNFLFEEGKLLAHEFVTEPSIWQDLYIDRA